MRLVYNKFFGTMPLVENPAALPEGFAQVALNCDLSGGALAPMLGYRNVGALGVAGVKSIHKFGYQSADELQWWFAFNQDVDCAKAPVVDDVEERTYFTGPWPSGASKLRKTRLGLGNSGAGPYPASYLDGSIPAPTNTPACAPSGGDTEVEPEVRVYVETFVTTWNEESEPGPPSARVTTYVGGTVSISNLSPLPSGAHTIDRRRIYRTSYIGNSQSDTQFVVELPVGTTTYEDTLTQQQLGTLLKTEGWDAAPEGLMGLTRLANQMAAAYKGFDVYFCVPGAMYAWPVEYAQPCDNPIVALGAYGEAVVALTKGVPYIGFGTDPEQIVMTRAQVPESCAGCESKRSVVSSPGEVFAVTAHGAVMFAPTGAKLITEKYVTKKQWSGYAPSSMLGALSGNKYILFYDNGTVQRGLILDADVPGFVETDLFATARAQVNGKLYLSSQDNLVCWGEGAALTYRYRGRRQVFPTPVNMSVGKVISDAYPLTLRLYAGGVLRATKTVTSSNEFTLPPGYTADDCEVEVEGTGRVTAIAVAESSEELQNVGS